MNFKPEVVTIGLGYIGLPTSALIASMGTRVLGVDINEQVVHSVNNGKVHIVEPELGEVVSRVVREGLLRADSSAKQADVFLIVVPTPFKGNYKPDISYVEAATKSIMPLLKKGDLVIIESTSPIGTTEKMRDLIYSTRPELKDMIFVAYCPERVLPGNVMYELVENDRVIGGIDENSTIKAVDFYKKYVKGVLHKTNSRTAEMCKLVENSSRDVQIAFANELSMICERSNINVWELINLANKHPRVNILQPGCGVGGHCIAVDPYFLVADFPLESKIIGTARDVNNYKSIWCVEKIQNEKLKFELINNRKPKTAFLGLAFKPNIDDLRESPASKIAEKVQLSSPADTHFFVEPNIESHAIHTLTDYKIAIKNADIVVLLVAHNEFKNIDLSDKIVLNFCGV